MRPYTDSDMPRLQDALAAWIHAAGPACYPHIGHLPHRIDAGLRGGARELVRVWEDAEGIAGFAICGLFDAAFDLVARPELRGAEPELAMLAAAADLTRRHLARLGRADEPVITDVYGSDALRRRALERLGFAEYRTWDDITERTLDEPLPAPQLPPGFTIRHATLDDAAQLAAARNDCFGGDWTAELYREAVMLRLGYRPERELLVVAPGGEVAAFTVLAIDPLNRTGLFEPVGTRGAFRRLGLARALLCNGLAQMRRLGMLRAVIAHDATNLPAGELYRGLGFQVRDVTVGYRS